MKLLCALLCVLGGSFPIYSQESKFPLSAKAYAIQDSQTNQNFMKKSIYTIYPMASLTKLGTAFLSLEHLSLEGEISIPSSALVKNTYESKADLLENESYLLKDLLYGLLLPSGNDVARTLAFQLEKKGKKFPKASLEWRTQNGLQFFTFEEPVGLSQKSQTNIVDLLKLLSLIEKNITLFNVIQTKEYSFQSKTGKSIYIKNRTPIHHYKNIHIFGKTGKTKSAGLCFAGFLKKDSHLWKIALLGSDDLEKDLIHASELVLQIK
jgi:serine-type D-Ala-D-Ala carboxypeptidase (penicillin-binding protein 5/6)